MTARSLLGVVTGSMVLVSLGVLGYSMRTALDNDAGLDARIVLSGGQVGGSYRLPLDARPGQIVENELGQRVGCVASDKRTVSSCE